APLGDSQCCELNAEPTIITIDSQARKAIPFAENQAAGPPRPDIIKDGGAQAQRIFESLAEESSVENGIGRPRIETDTNLAAAVVQPTRDKVAGVGIQVNLISIGWFAAYLGDGTRVDPRMAAEEWTGTTLPQDDSGGHKLGSQSDGG